jgi:hypothetical protein
VKMLVGSASASTLPQPWVSVQVAIQVAVILGLGKIGQDQHFRRIRQGKMA